MKYGQVKFKRSVCFFLLTPKKTISPFKKNKNFRDKIFLKVKMLNESLVNFVFSKLKMIYDIFAELISLIFPLMESKFLLFLFLFRFNYFKFEVSF